MKNTKESATLKANPAHGLRAELARQIASLIGKAENRTTDIPGLTLHRRTAPTAPCWITYQPGVTVVAQGSKSRTRPHTALSTMSRTSPYVRRFADREPGSRGTAQVPCLALSLKLDMSVVRELLGREEIQVAGSAVGQPRHGNW